VSACGETTRRRLTDAKSVARRLTDTAIEFEITAPDAASVDKLQESVASVATSGALVANVQQAAKNSGVLVEALSAMELVLPEPAITVAEKTVTQLVMVETVERCTVCASRFSDAGGCHAMFSGRDTSVFLPTDGTCGGCDQDLILEQCGLGDLAVQLEDPGEGQDDDGEGRSELCVECAQTFDDVGGCDVMKSTGDFPFYFMADGCDDCNQDLVLEQCGFDDTFVSVFEQPSACRPCVKSFEENGGCKVWFAGGDLSPLIPEGCHTCSEEATMKCGIPPPPPCTECTTTFNLMGGCALIHAGSDPDDILMPEGCQHCNEQAVSQCEDGHPTLDPLSGIANLAAAAAVDTADPDHPDHAEHPALARLAHAAGAAAAAGTAESLELKQSSSEISKNVNVDLYFFASVAVVGTAMAALVVVTSRRGVSTAGTATERLPELCSSSSL
jgi:hypothetical protein